MKGDVPAEVCASLASILRCFSAADKAGPQLHHILLIIPVALELIFSTSLIFTNWGSCRRHLFLVAEGWVFFLLSLAEVLSYQISAARDTLSTFKAIDQAIGALSFTQLLFYMAFLYAFVYGEVLPTVPDRMRRISRPLLLIFIIAIIAMNFVASLAGIHFDNKNFLTNTIYVNFVWTFFSSMTLALLVTFQALCFCFAFYRLIRAFLTQRNIETRSEDAAVMFRGIGWINAGIKVGAIETVIGYVEGGIKVAYIRRSLRMLSRALLAIGVAKGLDRKEDFRAIRDELAISSTEKTPQRSKLRKLLSNPQMSALRSPGPSGFPNLPRLQQGSRYGNQVMTNGRPHPYATNGYAQSPNLDEKRDFDLGLKSADTKHSSTWSSQRVTVLYDHGTPKLHLRLSTLDLPTPAAMADPPKARPISSIIEEYKNSLSGSKSRTVKTQGWLSTTESTGGTKEQSRFSVTSVESNGLSVYPPSTTHGHTVEDKRISRISLEPPAPAYLDNNSVQRSSGYSFSGLSAASAEIIDTPRRQLSITKHKSTYLARAVLYPVPPTRVALALTSEGTPVSQRGDAKGKTDGYASLPRSHHPQELSPPTPPSSVLQHSTLPAPWTQSRFQQQQKQQESIVDEDGNAITITALSPSSDEGHEDEVTSGSKKSRDRATRALSGYSVRSVPETLQAVRELANKFPGPPPGAVVANIGMQAPRLCESSSESTLGREVSSRTASSTDTDEVLRRRIPAEVKLKGRQQQQPPAVPLPPVPRGYQTKLQYVTAEPIDPFDDDGDGDEITSDSVGGGVVPGSELSPLSMSVKLHHPMSFISNSHPRNSGMTTTTTTTTTISPATPFFAHILQQGHGRGGSQEDSRMVSPGIVDFGTALGQWNTSVGGGGRPMEELPSLTMVEGHRRSMSAKSQIDIENERRRKEEQHRRQISAQERQEIDDAEIDELPDQVAQLKEVSAGLGRIKSIGKVPRRVTPTPTRGAGVRGSMHLQHIMIPAFPSSSGRDVPLSAADGGVDVAHESVVFSASTEYGSSASRGRASEVLSIEDGGYVPIRDRKSVV